MTFRKKGLSFFYILSCLDHIFTRSYITGHCNHNPFILIIDTGLGIFYHHYAISALWEHTTCRDLYSIII